MTMHYGLPVRGPKPNYQYVAGVPTPYHVHVHPYPTRYHGGIWTRPVFGMPYVQSVQSVFKPDDFVNGPGGAYSRYPWPQSARKPYSPLGQTMTLPVLTMSPERVAQLQKCSADCEAKYGVQGASTDVFALSTCFAVCNSTYPPDVALPQPVTPRAATSPGLPGLPGGAAPPPEVAPTTIPGPPGPSKATMLVGAGVGVAALVGLAYYLKKRKG